MDIQKFIGDCCLIILVTTLLVIELLMEYFYWLVPALVLAPIAGAFLGPWCGCSALNGALLCLGVTIILEAIVMFVVVAHEL